MGNEHSPTQDASRGIHCLLTLEKRTILRNLSINLKYYYLQELQNFRTRFHNHLNIHNNSAFVHRVLSSRNALYKCKIIIIVIVNCDS